MPDQDILLDKFFPKIDLKIQAFSYVFLPFSAYDFKSNHRNKECVEYVGDFNCPGLEVEYIALTCVLLYSVAVLCGHT